MQVIQTPAIGHGGDGGTFPDVGKVENVYSFQPRPGRCDNGAGSVKTPARARSQVIADDVRDLERLGYAQQLFREMGGFSNFAISFSIISVLTGAVLLFGYGLKLAGPVINSIGWPVVSLFTLCVAASMAELASAYPTAGGLYFWAFRLGGRTWAWTTAWLNMVGQVTITAGINVAAATYLVGAVTRMAGAPPDVTIPVFGSATNWSFQLAVMVAIMIPQVLINVFGIRLTARLNDFSVWWHVAGVAVIVALLAFLGSHHNSLEFLLSRVTTVTPIEAASADLGGRTVPALVIADARFPSPLFALVPGLAGLYAAAPFLLVFVLGLLQAQWTYTGYDASAHVAEETVMARMNSAWGVFLSVAVSAVVGYVLLLVLTWTIPRGDVAAAANDPYPVLHITYGNLSRGLGHVVAVIIGGAMWLCGLASITSMALCGTRSPATTACRELACSSACTRACARRCGPSGSRARSRWRSPCTLPRTPSSRRSAQ